MYKKKKTGGWLVAVLLVAALVLGVGSGAVAAVWMGSRPATADSSAAPPPVSSAASAGVADSSAPAEEPITPRDYTALPLNEEMRAMWLSFLEWRAMDFSSEEAASGQLGQMFDNCVALGLNTVIVSVRPFGDALYKSSLYPWSHVLGGAQGQDPGFDPLALMVRLAHERGLRIEAWVNPYRVKDTTNGPDALAPANPAALNPALVRDVGGNLWYDPGMPEVQQLVVQGVLEIVQNYDVDGIHFDDYFYPETGDGSFDADTFAQYGGGMVLEDWRRDNVNRMVQAVYAAIGQANPTASFGISVQGNNENNYKQMYADVAYWMANEGYIDYIMPQIYWGFAYRDAAGKDNAAFQNKLDEWAFYPRAAGVKLYAGLGAYRIGVGDGGTGEQAEWSTGHNLADMVAAGRAKDGIDGFALFRYEFLFDNEEYAELAGQETEALKALLS